MIPDSGPGVEKLSPNSGKPQLATTRTAIASTLNPIGPPSRHVNQIIIQIIGEDDQEPMRLADYSHMAQAVYQCASGLILPPVSP